MHGHVLTLYTTRLGNLARIYDFLYLGTFVRLSTFMKQYVQVNSIREVAL